mmetsp:Transcript_84038/g.238122  ORF Transcript_84038/g.238122 Transcript_84038/m.238122 type:complete len:336 (-) Transcript_84038:422-1429(-)
MFQSALYPALVTFMTQPSEEDKEALDQAIAQLNLNKTHAEKLGKIMGADAEESVNKRIGDLRHRLGNKCKYKMMIKNGDDVRQDQLVVQLIKVMDRCLKKVGMDLKLTTYEVLATKHNSGVLEFIVADDGSPSTAVELLDKGASGVGEYLRTHQPDPESELGIKHEALDTFSKSLAGYAVITYLLGVGDRHLGNVMMLPDGRFCHIDFGYIFGDDPKKKYVNPPPFRITNSMVVAMGGQEGKYFAQFCKLAIEAYKQLRRNAVLIMSLLRLMKDAGIEALQVNPDDKLRFVEERFRLDLDDESAEEEFLKLISDSLSHVGIQVLEGFHNIARAFR